MSNPNDTNKDQLIKCVIDLSNRANELEMFELDCILKTVAGVLLENRETEFAVLCGDYAAARILAQEDDE